MEIKPELSVIIPVLNEEENIKELISRLVKVIENELSISYEIIIIDDGSNDRTWTTICDAHKSNLNIKGLSFTRNFGHQYAITAGINNCHGKYAFILDGDLQHPPELLTNFFLHIRKGFDIVAGVRQEEKDISFSKRIFSKFFYWFFNKVGDVKIIPGTSDFRLISLEVIEFIKALPEIDKFYRALLPWSGFNTFYLPYSPDVRKSGVPKFSFLKSLRMGIKGIVSFSIKPLYISIYLGFTIASVSFIYGLYEIYAKLILRSVPPGFTDIIASILFLSGIQLIILGVLGIYIGKLKKQTSQRPEYLIKNKVGINT
jgi:polyisoprenyl-phosphate glycosyltransferase